MLRFLASLMVGLLLGAGVGLYLGWVQFPIEYVNSPASSLAKPYTDDYTVMIAEAYLQDGDVTGAFERMRLLEVENIPEHVQSIAEQYISTSQDVEDIRALVALSEALGRITPIMEPYRPQNVAGPTS